MATSKNAKKRKQSQKQHQAQKRQAHAADKSRERDHQRDHLPKTGTAEDDAYLLRRSREDVVDFGLTKAKGGAVTWIIAALVVIALIGLILYFIYR